MAKISREACAIAAANLVQAVMTTKPAKAVAGNAVIDPVAHVEGLYHRFFAMVRAMEE